MRKRIINYLRRKDRLISDLIIDKYFGIYNRNGFEYIISNLYKKENVFIKNIYLVCELLQIAHF